VRKPAPQRRQDVAQLVDDARRTRVATRTQSRPQQQPGAPFEPEQRVIHVLVVETMKERQLLGPVRRVIRAVAIEDEIGRMLVGAVRVRTEPVHTGAREPLHRRPVDRILEARQRRLRPERRASVRRDHLQRRIVAEPVGVVDVLVAGDDLIQPLADERVEVVRDVARVASVSDPADHVRTEAELLIEFSDEHQARVCRELSACEIDHEFRLESEAKLVITLCSHRTSASRNLSRLRSPRNVARFLEGDGISTYSFVNYPG
jgi:hypothetical protein